MSGDSGQVAGSGASVSAPRAQRSRQEWAQFALEEVIRPLAIAALVMCIAAGLGQVAETAGSAPLRGFWQWMALIVSLESIHSYRLLTRRAPTSQDRFRFRFVELVILLLAVRFGMYLYFGRARFAADVASWMANASTFLDLNLALNGLMAVVFWIMALQLARAFHELEATPAERMPSVTDSDHYLRSTMPRHGLVDRQSLVSRIVTILFAGGVVTLLLAGFARVDVRDLVALRHGRSGGVIVNLLLYFLISFLLISQAQYATLKAGWEIQGVPVLSPVGRRWLMWFLLFLLTIGVVSALLPVSYSVGLLQTIYTAVQWVAFAMAQIVYLLIYLFTLVFSLLMSLFRPDEALETPTLAVATPPASPAAGAEGGWPWWEFARSLLFWAVITGVIGYSIAHYVRDRWPGWRNFAWARWLMRLFGLWQTMADGARRAGGALRARLRQRRSASPRSAPQRPWRYLSLRSLSPRDRVRYFYLSTVRRGADQGLPRSPASTPLEYERTLADELPDAAVDIHALTDAFIEARYTARAIDPDRVTGVQSVWRHVRQALTARRKARTRPTEGA